MIDWDGLLLAPLYAAFGEAAQYEVGGVGPGVDVVLRRADGDREQVFPLRETRAQAEVLVLLLRVSQLAAAGIAPAIGDVVVLAGARRAVQAPPRRIGKRGLEWEFDTAPEDVT